MKHAKPVAALKRDEGRLSVHGILRVATLLALGATISILSITLLSTDPELWQFSGLLLLGTIAIIWIFTITLGCCMLDPRHPLADSQATFPNRRLESRPSWASLGPLDRRAQSDVALTSSSHRKTLQGRPLRRIGAIDSVRAHGNRRSRQF